MKFWDSSALVPLCLAQPTTQRARDLHRQDPEVAVWWASPVECASAIARVQRAGHLTGGDAARALQVLDDLSATWFEVQPADAVREQALRLLRVHPLRAADALQLAAAVEWAGTPARGSFVTLDDRLRDAAEREGFETP